MTIPKEPEVTETKWRAVIEVNLPTHKADDAVSIIQDWLAGETQPDDNNWQVAAVETAKSSPNTHSIKAVKAIAESIRSSYLPPAVQEQADAIAAHLVDPVGPLHNTAVVGEHLVLVRKVGNSWLFVQGPY